MKQNGLAPIQSIPQWKIRRGTVRCHTIYQHWQPGHMHCTQIDPLADFAVPNDRQSQGSHHTRHFALPVALDCLRVGPGCSVVSFFGITMLAGPADSALESMSCEWQ